METLFHEKKINYEIEGTGDTIILLHGFLESLGIWDYFSENLSKEYRVVRIDLPGHGKSDVINSVHTMELMAGAVKSVLDKEGVNKCIMAGHSMGGYTTLAFAEQYPEYLKGLVLFHSAAHADSEEVKKNRDRTVKIVEEDRLGFINNFIPGLFAPDNIKRFSKEIDNLKNSAVHTSKKAIVAALKGMKERTGKISLLKNTTIPVMYIIGKEDSRIPTDVALKQAALPNRCNVLLLGGVGHMGYIEAEDETLKALKCFAESIF
jgi:pimeloyl-ACP methyl ester carboxylesterase